MLTADLDRALRGVGTREWSKLGTPAEESFGSTIAMIEVPKFEFDTPDLDQGASRVIAERGYAARSAAVGADGNCLSPAGYQDVDVCFSTTSTMAVARTFSAQRFGLPASSDYFRVHLPSLAPPGARLIPEPQPYAGDIGGRLAPSLFCTEVKTIGVAPDGRHIAFVEQVHDGGRIQFRLIEESLADGHRRVLATPRDGESWYVSKIAYSPCGEWVQLDSLPVLLIRRSRAQSYRLPDHLKAATWDKGDEPGRLLATTVRNGELHLVRFDLKSGNETPIALMKSTDPSHLSLASMDVSADGRWLGFVAPVGLDAEYAKQEGSGCRAFVMNLADAVVELVLPVRFNCGIERDVSRIVWVQQTGTDSFEIREDAVEHEPEPDRLIGTSPDAKAYLVNEAKGGSQLVTEAIESGAPLRPLYQEFLRYSEAIFRFDPSARPVIEQQAQASLSRYTQSGLSEPIWLALTTQLQSFGKEEKLDLRMPPTASRVVDRPHGSPSQAMQARRDAPPAVASRQNQRIAVWGVSLLALLIVILLVTI